MKEILKQVLIAFLVLIMSCHKNTVDLQYVENNEVGKQIISNMSKSIVETEVGNEQITFPPLSSNENLKLYLNKANSNDGLTTFIICAEGEKTRRLFQLAELGFMHMDNKIQYSEPKNSISKYLVFAYLKENAQNNLFEEILVVDGKKGIARKLRVPYAADFKISNDGSFLCLDESNSIPSIGIYDLQTMKQIKNIQYLPYEDRGMYAVEMLYEDDAFIVTLSADTAEFTTLRIPIDDAENYHVIDSYEFDASVPAVSVQENFGPQLPK